MRPLAILVALGFMASSGNATPRPRSDEPQPDLTTLLHRYYGTRSGYAKVSRDVMKWHKTTQNGCVAFASTALRHIGVAIPLDAKIDGRGVSRITRSFSRYLAEVLGWTRIESLDELRSGDLVFSTDAPCCPGYPNHVVMFDGWSRRDKAIARVVDNQGFHIARPMIQAASSDVDGFGYALRPPAPT